MSDPDMDGYYIEPTFEFLLASLRMQAEMHLGLIWLDEKHKPEPNLPMARHMIDLMAMLTIKTKGNLTLEEERMLENTVTELRFRFVQVKDQARPGVEESQDTQETPDAPPASASPEAAGSPKETDAPEQVEALASEEQEEGGEATENDSAKSHHGGRSKKRGQARPTGAG